MLKIITAILLFCSGVASAAPELESSLQVTPLHAQFAQAYRNALVRGVKINPDITFMDAGNGEAIVINIEDDLTVPQARRLIVAAYNILDQVMAQNSDFITLLPNGVVDPNSVNLVVDAYDESQPKEEYHGVSSVMLVNGKVQFFGIHAKKGNEILTHKESWANATKMAQYR